MRRILLTVLLAAALPAHAVVNPRPTKKEPALATAVWDDDDRTRVAIPIAGKATIWLPKGEVVGPVEMAPTAGLEQVAVMDPKGRMPARVTFMRNDTGPDTGATIYTQMRAYELLLTEKGRAFQRITFVLPPEVVAPPAAVVTRPPPAAPAVPVAPSKAGRFSAQGDASIWPAAAWASGGITYLQFTGPVPAITYVGPDGAESVVNKTPPAIDGPRVVKLHGVWRTVVLRFNDQAACLTYEGEQ